MKHKREKPTPKKITDTVQKPRKICSAQILEVMVEDITTRGVTEENGNRWIKPSISTQSQEDRGRRIYEEKANSKK